MLSQAHDPVLYTKSQRAIAKICGDAVARRVTRDTRCSGESVESQSPQMSLEENSWTESDAISSGQHANFDGRRFRFESFQRRIIHKSSNPECKKSKSHASSCL